MSKTNAFPAGLYGITPEWNEPERLQKAVAQACEGGMRVLQWRHKTMPEPLAMETAASLQELCRTFGVTFIVNDNWQMALALDADGVHLGKSDASIATVRAELQRRGRQQPFIIGVSCYDSLDLAEQVMQARPDYIAFGALFPSLVKPEAVHAPLSLFRAAAQLRHGDYQPALVGIGGINPQNAALVTEAGADSIAVITGLFDQPDIRATAAAYAALFNTPS